ncbi:hypothetical protein Tco_1239919 [Tanacetum coccineum]
MMAMVQIQDGVRPSSTYPNDGADLNAEVDPSVNVDGHSFTRLLQTVEQQLCLKKINKLERQILDEKLMLVDDDGKPLNKVDYDPVNSDSNSGVEVADDETAQFMASGCANDERLYEDKDDDIYNTYDIEGLTKQELTLCDNDGY